VRLGEGGKTKRRGGETENGRSGEGKTGGMGESENGESKKNVSFPNASVGNPGTSLKLALGRCSSCSGSPPKTRGDDKQKETLSFPNVSIGNPELSSRNAQS